MPVFGITSLAGKLNGNNQCLHFELLSSDSFREFIFGECMSAGGDAERP